ncbi:MAG TPA: hypothetical protein DHU96_19850 [Actinobacteria bacterium]|nr:hypothetical protein [Actinomycetota bacterium]
MAQAVTAALELAVAAGDAAVLWAGDELARVAPPEGPLVVVPHAASRAAVQSRPAVAPPRRAAVADGLISESPQFWRKPLAAPATCTVTCGGCYDAAKASLAR